MRLKTHLHECGRCLEDLWNDSRHLAALTETVWHFEKHAWAIVQASYCPKSTDFGAQTDHTESLEILLGYLI